MADPTSSRQVPATITNERVSVFIDGRFKSFPRGSEVGDKLVDAIRAGAPVENIREIASEDLWAIARALGSTGKVILDDRDQIRLDGKIVDYGMAGLLKRMAKDNDAQLDDLTRFLEKVAANPNPSVAGDLYRFLEKGNLPITPEGDFLAFKSVQDDYFSFHAGSDVSYYIDVAAGSEEPVKRVGRAFYPIGGVVYMDRAHCDENRSSTCSHGLHACSFDYLPSYMGGAGARRGKILVMRINPQNVTAIPYDANETKLRCCRLEVVGEIPYEEAKDYFTSTVDRRHPVKAPATPEPKPVVERAWAEEGRALGESDGEADHQNGYGFDISGITYPDELTVEGENVMTEARKAFAQGYFEGYTEGFSKSEAGEEESADTDEVDFDSLTESQVISIAEDDAVSEAEYDFNNNVGFTRNAQYGRRHDEVNDDDKETYQKAFVAAYLKRWGELSDDNS